MAHRLKLVSFDLCPYVERSRIVLLEKGVPHEIAFIDLANKPAWFLAISPMGRVPVLLADDRAIFESMVINELIEELHPAPALMPKNPIDRAEARSWIVFANDVLMPGSLAAMTALAGAAPGDALAQPLEKLRDAFGMLEQRLAQGGGPFFFGNAFTLVDATYAPFFRRWRAAEGWNGAEGRLLDRFPRVGAWADALLARKSVVEAEPENFAARARQRYAERAAKARA
jgi:glutathione S-transferase